MTVTTEPTAATHPSWCDPQLCEREDTTTNPKCHPDDVHSTHRSALVHLHGQASTGPDREHEPAHLEVSIEMSAWDVDGYVEGPFLVFEGRDSLGDQVYVRVHLDDVDSFAPVLLAEIERQRA